MFTPAEVHDKKFPKAVFGGYDMAEVDDFLDALSSDYEALYKENAVLKSKMKVLAEKVEEYRSVDAAMRKALIVAQKMANEMTEEAKAKSEEIRNKARQDYEKAISALKDEIRNEERRLENIREETRKFVEASVVIYQRQIENLRRMISEPGDARSNIEEKAEEIEKSIKRAIIEASPAAEVPAGGIPAGSRDIAEAEQSAAHIPDEAGHIPPEPAAEDEGVAVFGFDGPAETEDDLAALQAPADTAPEDGSPAKPRKSNLKDGGVREINVGGVNIRVFEMDVGGNDS
jgi:cell division initiation protein